MRTLIWSPRFSRLLRRKIRQDPPLRQPIEAALRQLTEDPFHPSLHSHKLKGDLAGAWACTVDFDNRLAGWRTLEELLEDVHRRPSDYTPEQIEAEIGAARAEVRYANPQKPTSMCSSQALGQWCS